jgi:hypothetical protein
MLYEGIYVLRLFSFYSNKANLYLKELKLRSVEALLDGEQFRKLDVSFACIDNTV